MRTLYKAAVATALVAGIGGYAAGAVIGEPADLPRVGSPVVMTPPAEDAIPGSSGDEPPGDTKQSRPEPAGSDDGRDSRRNQGGGPQSGEPRGGDDDQDVGQNGAQGTGGEKPRQGVGPADDPAPPPVPPPLPTPVDEIGIGIDDDVDDEDDGWDDDDEGGDDD